MKYNKCETSHRLQTLRNIGYLDMRIVVNFTALAAVHN